MECDLVAAVRLALEESGGDQRYVFASLRPRFSNTVIFAGLRANATAKAKASSAQQPPDDGDGDGDGGGSGLVEGELRGRLARGETLHGLAVRGLNPLMYAASACDEALALAILAHATDSRAAEAAEAAGATEAAALGLGRGCPRAWLEARGDYGYSPLHFACESGQARLVEALLQRLAEEDAAAVRNSTAQASLEASAESLPMGSAGGDGTLAGASVCVSASAAASSALADALRAATTDMHLQKAVVQVAGQTPLHLAAAKGHAACVRLLLRYAAWADPALAARLANAADGGGACALAACCGAWARQPSWQPATATGEHAYDPTAAGGSSAAGMPDFAAAAAGAIADGESGGGPSFAACVALLRPLTDPSAWKTTPPPPPSSALVERGSSEALAVPGSLPWSLPSREWLERTRVEGLAAAQRRVAEAWTIPTHLSPIVTAGASLAVPMRARRSAK